FFGGDENGNARYLTDADKERFVNLFEGGGEIFSDLSINYLTAVVNGGQEVGTFAFSMSDNVSQVTVIPQGLAEFAMYGNPPGSVYEMNELRTSENYLRDFTLSYSREITNVFNDFLDLDMVSAGVSLKYIQGLAYAETETANMVVTTNADHSINVSGQFIGYAAVSPDFNLDYGIDSTLSNDDGFGFSIMPETAGSGFGVDLGLTAKMDAFTFGFAITDIGGMTWNTNVVKFESDFSIDVTDITDEGILDSLENAIKADGVYIDEVTSSLPTALRLGASVQVDELTDAIPGRLLVALDYNQGFNNVPRNSTNPRFSLGVEWRPWDIWPIRTGFSVGGRDGFYWSVGSGIDSGLFEFSFALTNFNGWVQANETDRVALTLGSRWRF
ncbi:MAG: DUF5723 family protein, partial [Melioribacteraceae bacterium]|nr:DUF5723 family protein [Melioribacteraceae bacterium]